MPLTTPKITTEPQPDEFPYGWRRVAETLPGGKVIYHEIPLTQEDFLDPQLEDQMVQNNKHGEYSSDLFSIFRTRYRHDPTVGVFWDIKMRWGIAGLKEPAPDVAVVPNLQNKSAYRPSFDVTEEGTGPGLIIEVVSPQYPGDDTDKVTIYEQAGVNEYFIINPHSNKVKPYYEIKAYRLHLSKYRPIQPDSQNYLLSQTTNVRFGVSHNRKRLILKDALTGQVLLTPEESGEALLEAEARAQQAEARAQQAEVRAQSEAKARTELENRLRELEAKLKK